MRYIKLIDRGYLSLTAFVMLSDEVINKLKEFKKKHGDESYKELLYTLQKKVKLGIYNDFYIYLTAESKMGIIHSVTLAEANILESEIKEWFDYYIDEKNWIRVDEFNKEKMVARPSRREKEENIF